MPTPKFQNNLKQVRLEHKFTQKDLADKFNQYIATKNLKVKPVTYASISRWETGENSPQSETWEALADLFGVTAVYLMGYSTERNDPASYAIELIDKAKFSDNKENDTHIKNSLEDIFADLYDQINELQRQIDLINDPSLDYDERE